MNVFLLKKIALLSAALCCSACLLCACGGNGGAADESAAVSPPAVASMAETPEGKRDNTTLVLKPEASGNSTLQQDTVTVDVSNASQGYIMVKYDGDVPLVKMQLTAPDGFTTYTYTVSRHGSFETFPLSAGSGTYTVGIFENVKDDRYSTVLKESFEVQLENDFLPFLYPNQYVNFTDKTKAVAQGKELAEDAENDFDVVEQVYQYVTGNVIYDDEKAATVTAGYLPNVDETLKTEKGICFDYASLMTAMLRSQRIPTKLQVGYSGEVYHAWISVYTEEDGWLDNVIEFDGNSWQLVDPTFASNNESSDVADYVGDGTNYLLKYSY